MKGLRAIRPAILALLVGLVLVLGAGGTTWAREDREPTFHRGRPPSTVPPREADLAIDKSGRWKRNDVIFTITVSNGGPIAASNVVVLDDIPVLVSFESVKTSQGSCRHRRGLLTCDLGTVRVDKDVRIEIKTSVRSRFTRQVTNVAVVSSTTRDPSFRNNIDAVTVKRP